VRVERRERRFCGIFTAYSLLGAINTDTSPVAATSAA